MVSPTGRKDCASELMSTCLSSLDPGARERYTKRLDVLGLKEEDDPYAEHNSHKFKDDLASWPPIEYGHILCYFVQRPGLYTQQEHAVEELGSI